jgi:hypothetical protein
MRRHPSGLSVAIRLRIEPVSVSRVTQDLAQFFWPDAIGLFDKHVAWRKPETPRRRDPCIHGCRHTRAFLRLSIVCGFLGWRPLRPPLQGLLPNRLTGLKSADVTHGKKSRVKQFRTAWDHLGCFRPLDVRLSFARRTQSH